MHKTMSKYSLLLQNNTSKEFFSYDGLTDNADTKLFYEFEVELDIPEGEYTYCVFVNDRTDVEYEFKTPLQETILHTEDGDVVLRDLQPETGLLRVGSTIEKTNIYENNENNTIFYYDE